MQPDLNAVPPLPHHPARTIWSPLHPRWLAILLHQLGIQLIVPTRQRAQSSFFNGEINTAAPNDNTRHKGGCCTDRRQNFAAN